MRLTDGEDGSVLGLNADGTVDILPDEEGAVTVAASSLALVALYRPPLSGPPRAKTVGEAARRAMHRTTLRFDADLWAALADAAEQGDVSI